MSAAGSPQHPQGRPNIVLFGFMATGKTTIGRRLAAATGMPFVDMDDLIVEREGRGIPEIFAGSGEPYFRACEKRLALELAERRGAVIATGGGVVIDPANVEAFGRSGLLVCLRADPDTILRRVAGDTGRPLLAGDEKMRKILALLDKRAPLYAAIPVQVDTGTLSVEQCVALILAEYGKRAA